MKLKKFIENYFNGSVSEFIDSQAYIDKPISEERVRLWINAGRSVVFSKNQYFMKWSRSGKSHYRALTYMDNGELRRSPLRDESLIQKATHRKVTDDKPKMKRIRSDLTPELSSELLQVKFIQDCIKGTPLKDYIDKFYQGNKSAFAKQQLNSKGKPLSKTMPGNWIKQNCLVQLHQKRLLLVRPNSKHPSIFITPPIL